MTAILLLGALILLGAFVGLFYASLPSSEYLRWRYRGYEGDEE